MRRGVLRRASLGKIHTDKSNSESCEMNRNQIKFIILRLQFRTRQNSVWFQIKSIFVSVSDIEMCRLDKKIHIYFLKTKPE